MSTITRYQKRIPGPLLDRIDIDSLVPHVECEKPADDRLGESSAAIRARVEAARERRRERLAGTDLACKADMGPAEIRTYCRLDAAGQRLMRLATRPGPVTGLRPAEQRRERGSTLKFGA